MSTLTEQARQGRREQQRLETVRLIKEAAAVLFAELGFEATTTKQIAERAGVAQGTVFLVAPSKEALLVTIFEEQLREAVKAGVASMPRKRVQAQLAHIFDGLFDFYARDRRLARVLVKAILFFSDDVGEAQYEAHVADLTRFLAGLLEGGRARGEVAARADVAAAATLVVGLYVHLVTAFLNAERADRAALDAGFRAGLETLFRGLRP